MSKIFFSSFNGWQYSLEYEIFDHNIKERVIGQIDRDGQLLEVWVEKQKEKLVEKTLTKINTLMDEIKPRMVDEYVKKGIFIEDNLDDE